MGGPSSYKIKAQQHDAELAEFLEFIGSIEAQELLRNRLQVRRASLASRGANAEGLAARRRRSAEWAMGAN